MREIVTLQFGTFSNFVGSHYWNLQNLEWLGEKHHKLDSNILFRQGEKDNFSPRLVAFDLKGSRRVQPITVEKDNSKKEAINWKGNVQVYEQENCEESEFWSDYLELDYHSRSVWELQDYGKQNGFCNYYEGICNSGFLTQRNYEDAWDNIRHFIEDCDCLQGIQCFVDIDSGWGAYADNMLTELRDECRSAARWTFTLDYPYANRTDSSSIDKGKARSQRNVNLALSMASLLETSTACIPIELNTEEKVFKLLDYNPKSKFEMSAIVASCFSMATMPARCSSSLMTLGQMQSKFAMDSTSSIMELAFNILPSETKTLSTTSTLDYNSFLFEDQCPSRFFSQWVTSRGLFTTSNSKYLFKDMLAKGPYQVTDLTLIDTPISLPPSYPNLYNTSTLESQNCIVQLASSNRIASLMRRYRTQLTNRDTRLDFEYEKCSIYKDDMVEAANRLISAEDTYE